VRAKRGGRDMKERYLINGNQTFFMLTVGIAFGMEVFAEAVVDGSLTQSQLETDMIGQPGYIRIDSTQIKEKGEEHWCWFTDKIREGFLGALSYEFSSSSKFEGRLSEKVSFVREDYKFELEIKEYERAEAYGYDLISPEVALSNNISDGEELGRIVYLTISLDE
jgi:hypothetical protein